MQHYIVGLRRKSKMRCEFLLIVFFVGLCSAYGYGEGRYEYREKKEEDDKNKCKDNKCDNDKECDMYGLCDDDYDNEKYFYEPCDYPDDVDCVRKFYSTYGQCNVVHYEDNKPVYRERYVSYLPKINLTLITTKVRLSQLNGQISTFYINKKTGNLVMAVDFKGIEINSKIGIFIVHRRGKEPAIAKDRANATYPVTLTAVIPINGGITLKSLKESLVTAFLPKPIVEFFIGPKVLESKDPAIAASVAGLLADIPTALQEIMLTEAPNFFLAYLQKYICDFGIPLSMDLNVRGAINGHH